MSNKEKNKKETKPIHQLLEDTTVDKLDSIGYQLRFVRDDEPVNEAVIFLETSHARAVPVVDKQQEIFANFGYGDLIRYTLKIVDGSTEESVKKMSRADILTGNVGDLLRKEGAVEPLLTFDPKTSVLQVARALVEKNAYRAFIVESGALVNVVSQSTICKFLLENKEKINKAELEKSLKTFGVTTHRPVYSVNGSSTLLDAFRYMAEKRITGIAVFNGLKLIGSISLSDFHAVLALGGAALYQHCEKIIERQRESSMAPKRPISLEEHHTVQSLLEHLSDNHIHRVWLHDHEQKIYTTVTYSDVIRSIVNEGWNDPSKAWGN